MAFERYLRSGQKLLRCGYTTGTCAALAAAGAARLLLTGQTPAQARLMTPKGWEVDVPLEQPSLRDGTACCAVRKDAGDDADATDGLLIWAAVRRSDEPGVTVDGGEGVGRVTRPGLDQPVGAAAINHVPRQMIASAVRAECESAGYDGGLEVVISVPGGEAVARKTFNPMLGVTGGLSILGTSGIVEPMSERALIDTLEVEMRQAAAASRDVLLTPGNYGEDFLKTQGWDRWGVPVVKCSNFLGDALDMAAAGKFQRVLLVGHAGKLVKVAGGIMNTHSRWADCRTELFCAHAAVCGADTELCRSLMDAATSDACIALLDGAGLRGPVLARLLDEIDRHLTRRAAGAYRIGAVMFSNEYGLLGQTETAEEIMREWTNV